ncbi:MAG: phosphoglycerate dehydrogenase [Archaeoglobi archaeon]|nr:phosphoglycerate dehydrogenase [Candidatus Mnemosynella bozhongmuii]
MPVKILITDPLDEEGIEELRKDFQVDVILKISQEELVKKIADYDAIIIRSGTKITREVIEAGRNLKVIGRAGVGVDNVDVQSATERGILVINTPDANTITTAEHAIAMMLAAARNIPQANEALRRGEWDRKKYTGVELYEKTLGIIGLGRIGSEVAKRAMAFGMKVIAYDPYVSEERAKELGVELTSFEELLERSDFISIHVPRTKETEKLIDEEALKKVKKGVIIVNCARGGIIDEEALYRAIKRGDVRAAALDVFEKEPPGKIPLLTLENVVATPHLGASTREAQRRAALEIAREVRAALKGEFVRNAVNMPQIPAGSLPRIKPYLNLAEKLSKFAAQIAEGRIKELEVIYRGDFTGMDLSLVTVSAVKGLLDPILMSPVNYVNAPLIASQRGISIKESRIEEKRGENLITVKLRGDSEVSVSGSTFNGEIKLREIMGYSVDFELTKYTLITRHLDVPGMVGKVGTILGEKRINIASMQVGRERVGGEAIMLLSVDDPVTEDVLAEIRNTEGIEDAKFITL